MREQPEQEPVAPWRDPRAGEMQHELHVHQMGFDELVVVGGDPRMDREYRMEDQRRQRDTERLRPMTAEDLLNRLPMPTTPPGGRGMQPTRTRCSTDSTWLYSYVWPRTPQPAQSDLSPRPIVRGRTHVGIVNAPPESHPEDIMLDLENRLNVHDHLRFHPPIRHRHGLK